MPVIAVRIPKQLAEQAIDAWARDDGPEVDETRDQRVYRHRAWVLALIGRAIQERGIHVADAVVVDLAADLVAAALDAAEDV